ncbi:MAG: reverse transcriptase domain-containing protein, partial [Pirellulaceae bacterium]|nr:reverse transcriptase domain-containing protein [Pirellulaceae bacterium]
MTTRQEIYDRIRATSKDEVILEEMIRLGFWPPAGETPHDPADEVRRRAELEKQMRSLLTECNRLADADALKRRLRQERMEESRRKRQQRKEQKVADQQRRVEQHRERKRRELTYLGAGVSGGLQEDDPDESRLDGQRLPVLRTPVEVADAMGVPIGELRFLAFHRKTSRISHYRQFTVAKKTGGVRTISAPMPRLKRVQEWILHSLLENVELHEAVHGFRKGRSIVTNAEPHVGAAVVVNLDLENFFPTVTYPRVKGLFRSLGFSESVATLFALVCTEPDRKEVTVDGDTYHVATSERRLPQGAPTSPAITNILCRGMDARLQSLAVKLGFRYSRYADDLTFSGDAAANERVGQLLRRARFVVGEEGFTIHPRKTRILRPGRRQEVTGLTVNERVAVSRKDLRRFRAVLHQVEREGPAGKHWGGGDDVIASIEGYANFVAMV